MHELKIINTLLAMIQDKYGSDLASIVKIQVEAGLMSNAQPILIQNAFEALIQERKELAHIDLEVIQLPIIAYCDNCSENFQVQHFKFICSCGEPSRKMIQGDELRVSKVEFISKEKQVV